MTIAPHRAVRRVRARRVSVAPRGLSFKARGAHRCVQRDGVSQTGVHHALSKALHPEWDYERAERAGMLQQMALPPATYTLPMPPAAAGVRRGPPQSSAKGGCKLDAQLTTTVKLHTGRWKVPTRAFFDRAARDAFVRMHLVPQGVLGVAAGRSLRTTVRNLLPETIHAWRTFDRFKLDPRSTQDIVACRGVGTRVDVVARDHSGKTRVIEIKRGCGVAYGNGRRMRAPYEARIVSTHDHYILQTLVSHKLFLATHPSVPLGTPLLMRLDAAGAHLYAPPLWATTGLPALMRLLYH